MQRNKGISGSPARDSPRAMPEKRTEFRRGLPLAARPYQLPERNLRRLIDRNCSQFELQYGYVGFSERNLSIFGFLTPSWPASEKWSWRVSLAWSPFSLREISPS